MTNEGSCRKVLVAAITASCLMLVLGVTYRVLAAQLLMPVSTTPIDPTALKAFPMQIADWTGQDVPLDEAIPPKIGAEAYVNRRYSRKGGAESVSLFIAASGTTAGTLIGHAPEVCNVYAGGTLIDQQSMTLPLNNGTQLPCRVLQVATDRLLDPQKKMVLYYYMANAQYCGDRSALRSKVRRGADMVRCVAQVQIAASTETPSADPARALACSFAADSASSIVRLFEEVEKNQTSNAACDLSKGK